MDQVNVEPLKLVFDWNTPHQVKVAPAAIGPCTMTPPIKMSPHPVPAVVVHLPPLNEVEAELPVLRVTESSGTVPALAPLIVNFWLVTEKPGWNPVAGAWIMALNQHATPAAIPLKVLL
jgi:hypothetical protein